ncbi:putative cupin -type protein [Eutypa lata UCREL1]|uniref:Putative cupin-type protein n=1 Tax=Eutypa lata (strain UCR-EL1) TaxID=1287681 RepID=M7TKQ7_EUTLA|nr:putative cupin -type protein [Eutypa lata UCREL1]
MPLFRPFVPYHNSAGQTKIVKFGGLLTTEFLEPPPGRCFLFRQTYKQTLDGPIPDNLRQLIESPMRPMGPLLHFHQFQTEYFRVESGVMGIELNGQHRKVYPENGEISVKAGGIHRFYIHPDSPGEMTVYLSASDSGMDYQLDRIFFENWYGYWHDALLHEGKLNFLQYLAIQDGGDAYSVPPNRAKTWGEQLAIDKGKPLNAEYEQWTIDLTEQGGSVSTTFTKNSCCIVQYD